MATKIIGKWIANDTIANVNLTDGAKQGVLEYKLVALRSGVLAFTTTATSSDTVTTVVEAAATVDTPQTALTAKGIYTGAVTGAADPKKVLIRATGTDNGLDDGTGDEVYGVLTEAAGVFSLAYKKSDGTDYTFSGATDIDFYFVEIFDEYSKPTDSFLRSSLGGVIDASTADIINAHLDGGANKHDATEIDYERVDGSKKNIQAASDDVESALTDLDDAIGALDATPTNYTATDPSIVADHLAGLDTAVGAAASAASSAQGDIDNHLDGTASKHDATEIDFEYADGSKLNIQAASDDVENALIDLDTAIGDLSFTPLAYTPTDPTVTADHLVGLDAAIDDEVTAREALATSVQAAINSITDSIGDIGAVNPTNYTPTDDTVIADHLAAIDTTFTDVYAQLASSGLLKIGVVAATTAALAANTYDNGTAGVGATLTADANGAFADVDGVTVTSGQRILVKNETAAYNGIYTLTTVGDGSNAWVLTRATDADEATELKAGVAVAVLGGTVNADRMYVLQAAVTTVGTDPLTWETDASFSTALFQLKDSTDATKTVSFDLSGITTATDRTITVPDRAVDFDNITELKSEQITLTGTDITNKYVVLTDAPKVKALTRMFPVGGPEQQYGVDFVVTTDDSDKRFSWDGYALDTVLESGDILVVTYEIDG